MMTDMDRLKEGNCRKQKHAGGRFGFPRFTFNAWLLASAMETLPT
jgi:hypothetical protein